jgi:hypothetical protein
MDLWAMMLSFSVGIAAPPLGWFTTILLDFQNCVKRFEKGETK